MVFVILRRKNDIGLKGSLHRFYNNIWYEFKLRNRPLIQFPLSPKKRAWWVAAFTLSAIACGFLIFNVYMKWVQSPVIVSFAEKSTPIWEIPFPAVTICPETKTYMDKLNFTDVFNKLRFNDSLDTIDGVA